MARQRKSDDDDFEEPSYFPYRNREEYEVEDRIRNLANAEWMARYDYDTALKFGFQHDIAECFKAWSAAKAALEDAVKLRGDGAVQIDYTRQH